MKIIATLMLLLLGTGMAMAGLNPNARVYIDFDPPNYVHQISPPLYTLVDAYICVDQLSGGAMAFSLRMEDPESSCAGVVALVTWQVLLPGPITPPPPPWEGPGTTLASTECLGPGPIALAKISIFYLGGDCSLAILDHDDYPRWVVDCEGPAGIDSYCVLANGSIGAAQPPSGDCPTPVESAAWGVIKALYR